MDGLKVVAGTVLKLCLVCLVITRQEILYQAVVGWPQPAARHPASCLVITPQSRIGLGDQKSTNVWKVVGWDQDSLLSEGKRGRNPSVKQAIALHLQQADWCPVGLWTTAVFRKPSPKFSLLSMTLPGMEYLLGHFGSALLAASPSTSYLLGEEGRLCEKPNKVLMLCKHCSAIAKTLVRYQHCFSHKSKTAPREQLWRKLTPSQPYPVQGDTAETSSVTKIQVKICCFGQKNGSLRKAVKGKTAKPA